MNNYYNYTDENTIGMNEQGIKAMSEESFKELHRIVTKEYLRRLR